MSLYFEQLHITGGMYTTYYVHTYVRPELLIDLIVNCDYWEIIDVQIIIMMSINFILPKEIPSKTKLCKSIWFQIQSLNCHKPKYRYVHDMLKDE